MMTRSATISACKKYRWSLTRRWNDKRPMVTWIMMNPSTADANNDDRTIERIIKFSSKWGYGGLMVANVYPYRSPNPKECLEWARYWETNDWDARDALMQNENVITKLVKISSKVIVAWGANPDDIYLDNILAAISDGGINELYCLGTTKNGHPKHPLARGKHYIPDDFEPIHWRK